MVGGQGKRQEATGQKEQEKKPQCCVCMRALIRKKGGAEGKTGRSEEKAEMREVGSSSFCCSAHCCLSSILFSSSSSPFVSPYFSSLFDSKLKTENEWTKFEAQRGRKQRRRTGTGVRHRR